MKLQTISKKFYNDIVPTSLTQRRIYNQVGLYNIIIKGQNYEGHNEKVRAMVSNLVRGNPSSNAYSVPRNRSIDNGPIEVEKRSKVQFQNGLFEYEGEWKKDDDGQLRKRAVKEELMIHGYGTMKWVQGMTYTGNF